jgi:MFS family permease
MSESTAFGFTLLCVVMYTDALGGIASYLSRFGVAPELTGVVVGAMPAAGSLVAIPIALLARRIGLKMTIVGCVALGIPLNLAYALGYHAPSSALVLASRIGMGCVLTSNQLSAMYVARSRDGEELARASVRFNAWTLLGYAIGPALAASLNLVSREARSDFFNPPTAPGWANVGLCAAYLAAALALLGEPVDAPSTTRANATAFVINLAVTFAQATAYSIWYINVGLRLPWLDWSVEARLYLLACQVALQVPAQFVPFLRRRPMQRVVTNGVVACVGSLLFVDVGQSAETRFVMHVFGGVVFGTFNMLVHNLNFSLAASVAPRPKDLFVAATSGVYMLGVATGAVAAFVLPVRWVDWAVVVLSVFCVTFAAVMRADQRQNC